MKKLNKLAAALLLTGIFSAAAHADEASVKAALTARYPATQVNAIKTTPIKGVYQVAMGKNLAYVSEDGRYFMFGSLYDMQTQTDLTANEREQVNKVEWSSLPLKNAIVTVKGNGQRKIAVFTDPDCPYCKQLAKSLDAMDNITVYNFLFPIEGLHPNAAQKAQNIFCAKDNVKAMDDWFLRGVAAKDKDCKNPIEANVQLAAALGLSGTPMIIAEDGRLLPGAMPKDRLDVWINEGASGLAKLDKNTPTAVRAPMPGAAK